jgi:crotonobetainyl-CoA:carnitine CoA-transferase CaiB-like acyl-CoA transferase
MVLPLQGIKVLDLTRVLAGPYTCMLLADLGADVIKIERPNDKGDEMRAYGPPFLKDKNGNPTTESPFYLSANRNKRAICVDITNPKGQAIVRKLAAASDVMVENYKVGNLAKYALDYGSLSKLNDRLIYCSITGFGQTGPMANGIGMDILFQALSGMMSMTGEEGGRPYRVGMAIGDILGALHCAYAILGALYARDAQGGSGQWIDMSLLDTTFSSLSHRMQTYLVSGREPPRLGNETAAAYPAGDFECSDGPMMMQASYDDHFARLCPAIGRPELAQDPRFKLRKDRFANRNQLAPILKAIFKTKTSAEWVRVLNAAQVICAPINTLAQAAAHPQIRHREMVVEVPHALAGTMPLIRNPARLSKTPLNVYRAPPLMGEHTDEVLNEYGYAGEEIARLREAGIIA